MGNKNGKTKAISLDNKANIKLIKEGHFIAEEVEPVAPLLVKYKDGELSGVRYWKMSIVLIKAIQEQQALITALTARVTALETDTHTH